MYVSYKQRNEKENPDQQLQHERGKNGTVDRLAYEITFMYLKKKFFASKRNNSATIDSRPVYM